MKGKAFVPVLNRGMITISITLANLMQDVDNTIRNVNACGGSGLNTGDRAWQNPYTDNG
jgi:hypothetical protein